MTSTRFVNAVLLFPAVFWFATGILDIFQNGMFYSYTSVFPFPFRMHTLTLLNMTTFYAVTFLISMSHSPLRNLSIAVSMIFLFNILWEAIYSFFNDWMGIQLSLMLLFVGIVLIIVLRRILSFKTTDKKKIVLHVLLFFVFFVSMIALNQTSFFVQMRIYMKAYPHNLWWFLLKVFLLGGVFIGGIVLIIVLNRIFGFLTTDKRKIALSILMFCGFLTSMTILYQGFFTQIFIKHGLLWLLSKILCLWGLFPLIEHTSLTKYPLIGGQSNI